MERGGGCLNGSKPSFQKIKLDLVINKLMFTPFREVFPVGFLSLHKLEHIRTRGWVVPRGIDNILVVRMRRPHGLKLEELGDFVERNIEVHN
ncbi:hypothetical protein Vadar_018508 [Vaccinium darrowii]|uniref:Uncharacterized protein n=1 Tax=Vaccinium darrowii TaxID=229202 RepID=A0ACB7X1X9_9ERIC|nr:hypothetical protein Vadar_018508 [Vaccinium darrowii]